MEQIPITTQGYAALKKEFERLKTIERPENIDILRLNGQIFWLQASVAAIVSRIQHDTQRPALVAGKTFTE